MHRTQADAVNRIFIAVIALVVVMIVSGCTFPGSDIFSISKPVTKQGSRDILTINNVRTIPYSPVLPSEDVTLEFVIENIDENKYAGNVYSDLYDSAFMKCKKANSQGRCLPSTVVKVNKKSKARCSVENPCSIMPLDQEQVFYDLVSPSESEIAGITSSAQVSFRVLYDAEGSTTMDLVVANYDEIERAQRTGQTISATSSRSLGSGPVEIEMELMNRDYALSGKSATLKVQIVDLGSHGGSIKDSKIPKGHLLLDFGPLIGSNVLPQGAFADTSSGSSAGSSNQDSNRARAGSRGSATDSPLFDLSELLTGYAAWTNDMVTGMDTERGRGGRVTSDNTNTDIDVSTTRKFECGIKNLLELVPDPATQEKAVFSVNGCTNTDDIKLIDGKSPAMIFHIDKLPNVDIFRTFKLKAKIYYTYELRDSVNVEVKPYGS